MTDSDKTIRPHDEDLDQQASQTPIADDAPEEKPPLLGSWNKLYMLVLSAHALLIAVLYLITQMLS